MRRDDTKITWISSLLRREALNWHRARKSRYEKEESQNDLEIRFVDLETQKDEEAMRKLRYDGSISNYLAQ